VITKLISAHELTDQKSSTAARRFGVTRVRPIKADCKVSIGAGDFVPGASLDVSISNKISDADMAIGELLRVERENCVMLAWDLCPDISDAMAEEYVEHWFRQSRIWAMISEVLSWPRR
jgi:hypothetical protein